MARFLVPSVDRDPVVIHDPDEGDRQVGGIEEIPDSSEGGIRRLVLLLDLADQDRSILAIDGESIDDRTDVLGSLSGWHGRLLLAVGILLISLASAAIDDRSSSTT